MNRLAIPLLFLNCMVCDFSYAVDSNLKVVKVDQAVVVVRGLADLRAGSTNAR